ncbi:MAG: response regulator [Fuerstiella sp.]
MIQNNISLPLPSADLFASAALSSAATEPREIRNEIPMVQVLVIEDSEAQIQLISGMLRKDDASRFIISIARDLREGLNQLSTNQFDVVLLDLTLPDCTGLESCIRLSEAAPDVSIVVLTGLDDEELAVSTLQHGAEDYLVKGQTTSHLLVRATRYAVERKKSRVELQRAHDELEIRVQKRTAELQQMQEAAALHQDELAHASRLDTLGEMASGLAHELNQPLMAIIGFTDHTLYMIRNGQGDSERCIELIEDAGKEAKRAG